VPEVLRLGRLAAARLPAHATGFVHSVFSSAINVELTDGAWVTFQGPGPLRAPFALACTRVVEVRPGALVTREVDAVQMGSCRLRFDRARVVASSWPHVWDRQVVLARLPVVAPAFPLLATRARALGVAITRADAAAFAAAARELLGLGPGLTPSGDDCLVGALAALSCHGGGWRERVSALGPSLAMAARGATTRVAAEFVTCALVEEFSEPLRRATASGDAADLFAFGATSGHDTLLGVRTALSALV
jgi:hypothetical protein